MGWYKIAAIQKTAGYNADDSLAPQLTQLYHLVKPLVAAKVTGADKCLKHIETALASWNRNRFSEDKNAAFSSRAAVIKATNEAVNLLNMSNTMQGSEPLSRQVQQSTNQGQNWKGFGSNPESLAKNITFVPAAQLNNGQPGPDKWISIQGVPLHPTDFGIKKVYKNPHAEWVQQQMGAWMQYTDNGKSQTIFIRGTRESWNKFLSVAGWLFANDAVLKKYKLTEQLPSEKQFDPSFQEEGKSPKVKDKPLNATLIEGIIDLKGTKSNMPGIRLAFPVDDPAYRRDFPFIRDFILDNSEVKINPSKVQIHWDSGVIELYDFKTRDRVNSESLYRVAKKLQDMGYQTKQFNALIQQLTGMSYGDAYKSFSEDKRNQSRSVKTTVSALNGNLYENGPRLASRFNKFRQQLGILEDEPITNDQYEAILKLAYAGNATDPSQPWGPNNWVGPYGPEVPEQQRKAQTEGMSFVSSRISSILADEPGSGKTAQAIVGADSVREDGQKILVVTPNGLAKENWLGADAKGPMMFCGHDRKQIADVRTAADVEKAMADPNVIWIVVRRSSFEQTKKFAYVSDELAESIKNHSVQNKFAAFIIDEIQQLKAMDGASFSRLQKAVSAYHIPHRIGLTGTPADNTPQDMFVQLTILRHRVLYEDKGTENLVTAQNAEGFANQYLGGAELSKGVTLSDKERTTLSDDEKDKLTQERWAQKAFSVLQWTADLDDKRKENILDLFSNTFLRREKEDINPHLREVAPKTENSITVPADPEVANASQKGENWHTKIISKAAMAKAPATAQKTVELLKSDPKMQVFIGTQRIEVANRIAELINAQFGSPVSQAVTGELKEDQRANIATLFRQKNSPLRAVIYTGKLGSVGLNFNNAQQCIMNDLDWNPSTNEQMGMRIDRIDTKHPITITYMMMENSYDEEMYNRVLKKRGLNKAMTDLMRQARITREPSAKVALANDFVKKALQSILIDQGLTPDRQKWFDDNLEKAFRGEPIETLEQMKIREQQKATQQPVDVLMPDYLKEPVADQKEELVQEAYRKQWREKTLNLLLSEIGPKWQEVPVPELQEFLAAKERERLEKRRQEREMVAQNAGNWFKKAVLHGK